MRALAITGMVTASWMPRIISGALMRATPPSRRMSEGTRSSAMTAAAPASSAIFASLASTTSMMTPPLSISARPALTRNVASSRMTKLTLQGRLLEPERLYPLRVLRRVAAVHAVRQRLHDRQQRGVRAHVGRRVRRVVQADLRELGDLAQRRVGDRHRLRLAMARELHRAHDQRVRAPRAQADDERVGGDAPELAQRLLRRRGDDLGAQVEQREQVAQVRREE